MSLHRLSSARGLLASKGAATPLGLRKTAIGESEAEAAAGKPEPSVPAAQPAQLTLVTNLEDGAALVGEPPPPASLLPFALHRKRPEQSETWELVSPDLLKRMSQVATAGTEPEPAPRDDSTGPQQPDRPDEVSPPRLAAPRSGPGSDPLEASNEPSLEVARPAEPAANPVWRAGAGPRPMAWDTGPASWLGWGAAAILLVAGIAWWSFHNQTPAPAVEPSDTKLEAQNPVAVQAETSPEPASSGPVTEPQAAEEAPSAATEAEPSVPSVDLVRVEPNGDAVIAGRAAPNAELILLDNGTPIGSVKADAFGEWVFVPEQPLPQGAHEFGLVLKAVQGKVTIPAEAKQTPETGDSQIAPAAVPPSETMPASGDGAELPENTDSLLVPPPPRKPAAAQREGALVVPIPERRPDFTAVPPAQSSSLSPPSADFVVQLASVKTRDGARREWRKLQSQFPKALSGMDLNLHETKLTQQGTVIRVRTGPFPGFDEAVNFCAQIRTGRQDCLVVRTGGGN